MSGSVRAALTRRIRGALGQQHIATGSDAVLLTFDDGPHPSVTPAVLEILRHYGARAIFFVVGSRVPRAPHLLEAILRDGHLIGNHTYEHPLDRQFGPLKYWQDVARCQRTLESMTGVRPRLFRPALGHLSLASVTAPRLLGLKSVLWSMDSDDWRLRSDEEALSGARRLLEVMPTSNAREIVLMHDDNLWTPRLLEVVVAGLAARGIDLASGIEAV
jgi:peptidoglycan-N-acetylglucosamine deacetylase